MRKFFKGILKQSDTLPTWIGAIFTQIQMSLMYVGIGNIFMLAVTMWYTAGHDLAARYAPFITAVWQVLIIVIVVWGTVILLNWKYVIPAKQRHMNDQVVVHANPSWDLLQAIEKEQKSQGREMAEIKRLLETKEPCDGTKK